MRVYTNPYGNFTNGEAFLDGSNNGYGNYGNFKGQAGFVGCRFDIGGNQHYGWIEAEVNNDVSEFTIKGYAYEETPNAAIIAGDTTSNTVQVVRLEDVGAQVGQPQPNPASHNVQLPLQLEKEAKIQVALSNSVGQRMEYRQETRAAGEYLLDFSVENYPPGIYFIQLRVGNKIISRKLSVQ